MLRMGEEPENRSSLPTRAHRSAPAIALLACCALSPALRADASGLIRVAGSGGPRTPIGQLPNGTFRQVLAFEFVQVERLFRAEVLLLLVARGKIAAEVVENLLIC